MYRSAFEAVGGFDERRYASEEIWLSLALRKRGRFVILREHVITSGRKLRVYSLRETFQLFGYLLRTGPRALRQREGLEFWYGERRADTTEVEGERMTAAPPPRQTTVSSANRRQFLYPRLGLFELRRNAEQHVLPSVCRHEMYTNRQAVFTPV